MTLNSIINKSENFASDIEALIQKHKCNYIDAVIMWCEKHGIEPETAGKLVNKNKNLKLKMKSDAEDLNYMKKPNRLSFKE